ncbi:MAG TPA: thioredoxin-like domain-containing protein, partial [Rhodothermales bacterium]|nr:thioredoxin-like domain-containing protein [Rhodothermales bacterium]
HSLSLDSLRGRLVLLEFYAPQNTNFQRETEARKTFYETFAEQPFSFVSLSLEPDTLLNEAFWESYDFPGERVILSGAARDDLVSRYNINVIPTRFLIDQDGKIVGKYVGSTLPQLQNDVMVLLSESG